MNFTFDESVFGKNDIRGIVGQGICKELFYCVGKAYSADILPKIKDISNVWVTVGKDARLHSNELTEALIKGLNDSGVNVVEIGLVPSPFGYFSEYANILINGQKIDIKGTLIVTASHNPSEYNGVKMTFEKTSFSDLDMKRLKELTKKEIENPLKSTLKQGICEKYDIISEYINKMSNEFTNAGKSLKIVVDSANATAGVAAPELYRKLGCEVIDIFTEPDGRFPNHHPNPSDEKTLDAIKAKIKKTNADFGIAFDGDADRVGIIDDSGYSIPGDQLLLILALDILQNQKFDSRPAFISEVKCSQILFDEIDRNGGNAIMWKTGHGFIKSKLREENAVLAGEMSGHIFFNDRFYGYDDAIYAGCRFIEIISKKKIQNPNFKVSELIANLPQAFTSREVRFPCPNDKKQPALKNLEEIINQNPDIFGTKIEKIITIDGLRIVFNDGFALIRQSNTEPVFTMRFEAKTEEKTELYKNTLVELTEKSLYQLN
ncbi:MAG: phosphomannomutase/phosphoglucomutase [Candidatus Gastranaerophilales bacterium]|nr:phosphomannomutase/phosphoglucomutase [Candidatus Gastranaerophilales bacterium]